MLVDTVTMSSCLLSASGIKLLLAGQHHQPPSWHHPPGGHALHPNGGSCAGERVPRYTVRIFSTNLTVLNFYSYKQEASLKTDALCTVPPKGPVFFYAYWHTFCVVFGTELKQENVRLYMFFIYFFAAMDQNKEKECGNISTLTLLFLESSAGLFWEWMR